MLKGKAGRRIFPGKISKFASAEKGLFKGLRRTEHEMAKGFGSLFGGLFGGGPKKPERKGRSKAAERKMRRPDRRRSLGLQLGTSGNYDAPPRAPWRYAYQHLSSFLDIGRSRGIGRPHAPLWPCTQHTKVLCK